MPPTPGSASARSSAATKERELNEARAKSVPTLKKLVTQQKAMNTALEEAANNHRTSAVHIDKVAQGMERQNNAFRIMASQHAAYLSRHGVNPPGVGTTPTGGTGGGSTGGRGGRGPGGGPGGGRGGGGSIWSPNGESYSSQALSGFAKLAGGVLAGMTSVILGSVIQGYQRHVQTEITKGQAIGLDRGMGREINSTLAGFHRGNAMGAGEDLGFNKNEVAQLLPLMAKTTGVTGSRELQQAMRSTGMDAGESLDTFSAIRQAGYNFRGSDGGNAGPGTGDNSSGGKEFAKWVQIGMKSGIEAARLPELFKGMQATMEQQLQTQTGIVDGTNYLKTLALFGQTGKPGMQGARGAALLSQMNQGIINPGSGQAGQMLMLQSFGFGKPGGTSNYYDALKRQQKGATKENIMSVMAEVKRQAGGGRSGAMTLSGVLGTSLDQSEQLLKIYNSSADVSSKIEEMTKVTDAAKTLEEEALEEMKKQSGYLERIASNYNRSEAIGSRVASLFITGEEMLRDATEWAVNKGMNYLEGLGDDVKNPLQQARDAFTKLGANVDADSPISPKTAQINKEYNKSLHHGPYSKYNKNESVSDEIKQWAQYGGRPRNTHPDGVPPIPSTIPFNQDILDELVKLNKSLTEAVVKDVNVKIEAVGNANTNTTTGGTVKTPRGTGN